MSINCSDDDSKSSTQITTEDLIINVDELPLANNDFIGTIESNLDATFTISSQNPSGALRIDSNTGVLEIANIDVFDFEIHPVIQATVDVSTLEASVEANVTINLNNIDEIEFYLSDSEADYLNANDGDWILITQEEYNLLAASLIEVTKSGTTDIQYDGIIQTEPPINEGLTIINNNNETLPIGSYLFAFKYHAFCNGFPEIITDAKVWLSETDIANGYYNIGSNLAPHSDGDQYFVLKGNDAATNSTGFLGICESEGMGYKRILGANVYSNACYETEFFNEEDNASAGGLVVMYQGLSTTHKQWD